jgi:transketolase
MAKHPSQRGYFADELHKQMEKNENIWVLTGDLGFGMLDKIRDDFPKRFVNCGASEQAMMGIAVGLALKGKTPFVYSITPFLLRRPYETIKLYLDGEKIPVHLVGGGRDKDYAHDGPSHDATDVKQLLMTLPNITQFFPEDKEMVPEMVKTMVKTNRPSFISLRR